MKLARVRSILPDWKNVLAALASAILLIGAFPDFEFWFIASFTLVPLLWAVERVKASAVKAFVLGWIFGTVFFFGTCWWLTFAPITYAGFAWPLAYFLMFGVSAIAGIFPGLFAAILSVLFKRFGNIALFVGPFVWVFTEFLRYWFTGNNWNAIGYIMASKPGGPLNLASYGGVLLCSFYFAFWNCTSFYAGLQFWKYMTVRSLVPYFIYTFVGGFVFYAASDYSSKLNTSDTASVIAIQPNVPMAGMTEAKWNEYRRQHVRLAETALVSVKENPQSAIRNPQSVTVIFPESPMNFMYEDDPETKEFINSFAVKNNVSVLFNSAEPDKSNGKFFNSAVMVGPEGKEIAQYDKIYLLPFGEAVPFPLEGILPGFVGNFSYGREYDLLPVGDAKAGVMICFESHFGQLSREYVRNGADVIIEMTNDGYLGPTPVLRQHLANAVFRAVETNRPVLRVTNVGITAYINERGEVLDAAESYVEATRVWSVAKSDGGQTFYVKYGDWFAWLCTIITFGLLTVSMFSKRKNASEITNSV